MKKYNISYFDSNFKEWFDYENIKPKKVKLYIKKLERNMLDKKILAKFKPTEITLEELFGQLKNLDKSDWYVGYIRDKNSVLRAVDVRWFGGGWDVYAYSVEHPDGWDAGVRVFSRDYFDTLAPSDTQTLGTSPFETLSLENRVKKLEAFKEKVEKVLII